MTERAAFHRALFLLAWDGRSDSQSLVGPTSSSGSYLTPLSDADLGLPTGPVHESAEHVFSRSFQAGDLYLNVGTAPATITPAGHSPITIGIDDYAFVPR